MSISEAEKMNSFRWRVILAVSNLALALGMSLLGLREYESFRVTHVGAFYHGHSAYLPPTQLASYCLNAPPFLATNVLSSLYAGSSVASDRWWFYYVSREFYLYVFLFWWWVGWQVDLISGQKKSLVSTLIGAVMFLGLCCAGGWILWSTKFPNEWVPGGRAIPVSMLVWGFALLIYSGKNSCGVLEKAKSKD
jgi:hypothetical protein